MVSTSNCPPLVAMSVGDALAPGHSSRFTPFHGDVGVFAVNSLVSACIRIMSGLFTLRWSGLSVRCKVLSPTGSRARGAENVLHVTSLNDVEHMPTLCNYVHTGVLACQDRNRASCTGCGLGDTVRWESHYALIGWRRAPAGVSRLKRPAGC